MSKLNTIAVVGGGLAGVTAALTLRREGFAGRVVLIGDEPHAPYNRPALSKDVVRGERDAGNVALRTPAFYEDRDIELRLGTGVTGLETAAHEIVLDDGARIPYDAVLLATGGRARVLPGLRGPNAETGLRGPNAETGLRGPNAETGMGGARVLRTLDDSVGIRDRLGPGRTLVIVGAGFIGCELAASARSVGTAVSVVEVLPRPLARALPAEVSDRIVSIHHRHDVDLRTGFAIESLDADDDRGRVTAADGTVVAGDTLVVAVGILPETTLAERSGLEVGNGIVVDDRCRTSAPDVYAAGDVANHPNPLLGHRVRIEHWQNAQHQAAAAARNMLGVDEAFAEIPWVWSDQYDQHLEIAGIPRPDDEVVVRSNPESDDRESLAFCLRDGRLVAAVGFNCPKDVTYARRIITAGGTVERAVLADHRIPLAEVPGAAG